MTTFLSIMGTLIAAGLGATLWFFRKGGKYNPMEPKDFTELPYMQTVDSTSVPFNHVLDETVTASTPEATTSPVEPLSTPISDHATLEQFCLAIRDFEGKPGDQNYRLNNPGNARWNPSGYMPMYGIVEKSPNGFAIFSTYALGWLYLMNMIRGQIHKRPNSTILEFMTRYAPPVENPTVAYATFIGKRLGVDPNTFLMKNLV